MSLKGISSLPAAQHSGVDGFIPLAIDHAGAYIEAGKCDIDQYLMQLSMHQQALMSDATFTGV